MSVDPVLPATSPMPAAGTSAPSDAGAPQAPLDAALARLVARGVLTHEQADAVRAETAALPAAEAHAPAAPVRPAARARLVEVAAYLGAVLVAASVVAFLADSWEDLTSVARLALLAGSGLVAYAAGAVVATTVPGGFRRLRAHEHAARRRVSSALMALGSLLLAFAAAQVLDGVIERPEIVGTAVALALLVVAQVLASSAITEIGMLGSTLMLAALVTDLVVPDRAPDWSADVYQPSVEEIAIPAVLAVVGLLWAAVVSRLLTLPVAATALGCVAALFSTLQIAFLPDKRLGLAMLAALAVVGLVLFLRVHLWPWLALTVGAVTVFVFVVVADQAAPALAFLVAGLVLLAGALGAALLGRRTARRAVDAGQDGADGLSG